MGEIINVLWTGGWDSTFRIVELSRQNVTIQPIYVIDPKRRSVPYELCAMDKIMEILKTKKDTVATLCPLLRIDLKDIPENEEITEAYNIIRAKTHLGIQHEWLARLAVKYPGIELGTEAGSTESSRILKAVSLFGVLENKDGRMILSKERSTKEGLLVLGNVSFPIINKTERDMKKLIERWGYEDVMRNIWFCHNPSNGMPCGICHPCQVKLASDMEFLLPEKTIKKGKRYKIVENCFGGRIAKKIFRLFK